MASRREADIWQQMEENDALRGRIGTLELELLALKREVEVLRACECLIALPEGYTREQAAAFDALQAHDREAGRKEHDSDR